MKREVPMIEMVKIRQQFSDDSIEDPAGAVREAMEKTRLGIYQGMTIGVAVGSRGIGSIECMVRTVIDFVKSCGAHPFIIPAMGSHGGATAEGQRAVLAGYGITEATMEAPIEAGMEVVRLEAPDCECGVHMSRKAAMADGVLLVNRIKPHTDYHGDYESGLVKMSVIGLGKHVQALEIHKYGVRGLRELLPVAAARIFATGKILGGIAIVENRLDRPSIIEAVPGHLIMAREPELLQRAVSSMPRLPVEAVDVLVVDQIGKDYSGTGLDTNVIGRMHIRGEPEPQHPSIKSIMVRDLSVRSHGNALGIGMADVITRRLFDKIDFGPMYENSFTSTFLERVKIPVIARNDAEAFAYALRNCGWLAPGTERVVRIRNTLQLDEVYVSLPVLHELANRGMAEQAADPVPLFNGTDMCGF